jgi:DNA-binding NtrC family response regulator
MATILIVEDDPRLEETYDLIFQRHGHTVLRARDGEEGLEKALESKPDVILLDMLMPRMHGIEFLKQFEAPKHPETKIIVFSNMETSDLVKQAMDAGAYRYEVKSKFSPKELAKLVDQTLADRKKANDFSPPADDTESAQV